MGIVYFISLLMLISAFILIKKTDKTLNILSFIGITLVVMLCYNAFICYILTFVRIPVTIISLSIINVIFTIIIAIIIYKKKQIQKYSIDKMRSNMHSNNIDFNNQYILFKF